MAPAIPHLALAGGSSPLTTVLLFIALILWVATSSALRAPTWVMIVKYAANPSVPWLAALVFVGVSVAAALSSYIGVTLRNTDPRLPFGVSSVTLFLVTVGMVWMERSLDRSKPVAVPVAEKRGGLLAAPGSGLFLTGVVLLALGFQAHIAFNSIPQYLRFATPADFDTLLPIFWVGFNILSLPAAALTPRWGGPRVLACAAILGAIGTAIAATAPNLGMTILGQALAGGAWGSILTAGLSTALFLGRTGREGATSGLWFSTQSLAAALRIGIVVAQVDAAPEFSALSAWAPPLLWSGAAIVLACAAWRAGASEKRSLMAV
ncbi:MAG: Major facilitator superfamily 1 [Chloroflexi bacterium]|nr:Major facilitator superfamily 1 [Chloroflexota bacterium]